MPAGLACRVDMYCLLVAFYPLLGILYLQALQRRVQLKVGCYETVLLFAPSEMNTKTRKRSDSLYKHVILPVCKETGFEAIRIDKENTGSITEEIFKHLNEDDLVIADLTENNPNAFYEMGYRSALNKPSIHLMTKDSTIPFDVSAIRSFSYDLSDLDSVEEVKGRLIQTISSMNFDQALSEHESPRLIA